MAAVAVAVALTGCGASTEDVEGWVREDLQSFVRSNEKLAPYYIDVLDVSLVEAGGNQYRGVATVRTARRMDEHKVPVTVTYDGDEGLWETERGAWLFLAGQPKA